VTVAAPAQGLYELNRTLNESEFREGKSVLESFPRELGVVVTTRCNLSCVMCVRDVSNKLIPYEAFRKIEALYPYVDTLNWQGGEAFLADYFEKAVLSAGEHPQIRQDINTAGVLITKRWADVLVRSDMTVMFSIDGVTRDTYERIRKGAKFETLLRSLGDLNDAMARRGRRIKMILTVIVMRSNYREVESFIEFARRHGFQDVYFNPVLFVEDEENIFFHQDAEARRFLDEAMPRCRRAAEELHLGFSSSLPWGRPLPSADRPAEPAAAAPEAGVLCRKPWKKLFVDVSRHANVYPECFCPVPAGNLLTDSLADIWNGPVMQEYRRRVSSNTAEGYCSPECTSGRVDRQRLM
jgi:MoaA/NifB/PqqE/SkfB family radical SAM enzyme